MTHPYLRSVGFSNYDDRKKIQELVQGVITHSDTRRLITREDGVRTCVYMKAFATNAGIAVCGELDENETFLFDYYYPYLRSDDVSTAEDISVEKLTTQEAYEGMVDEARGGVSLIFYVNNMVDYLRVGRMRKNPLHGASLALSALAESGTIIMPIMKTGKERDDIRKKAVDRYRLISAAKRGNESAIETLTLEDMDTYTSVTKKIKGSDIFTLVDSYFMPFGVECDHYSILGEIVSCRRSENGLTGEGLFVMKLLCNDLYFDVCVNEADVLGEPMVGRRFKGNIWMQGRILFVE